jgi:hypothetical protein
MIEYGKQAHTFSETEQGSPRKSGRASFEDDGRSIWEWQTATGVFTRNVTQDELTRLSTVELKIVEPPSHTVSGTWIYEQRSKPSATESKGSARKVEREGVMMRLFKRFR